MIHYMKRSLIMKEIPYYIRTSFTLVGNPSLYMEIPYHGRKFLTIERIPSYRRTFLTMEIPYEITKSFTIEGNPLLQKEILYYIKEILQYVTKSLTIERHTLSYQTHKHNLRLTKITNIGQCALVCTRIPILQNTCRREYHFEHSKCSTANIFTDTPII